MSSAVPRRLDPAAVRLDDVVRLRKVHPCGSDLWRIVRVGADMDLRCTGCGRTLRLSRGQFATAFKAVVGPAGERTA